MAKWSFGYISQCLNVHISIEPYSWLVNQPILRLIGGMSIYKSLWIDGSVYSTVWDGYLDFGSCRNFVANVANLFSPSKRSTKWQRKLKTSHSPRKTSLRDTSPSYLTSQLMMNPHQLKVTKHRS